MRKRIIYIVFILYISNVFAQNKKIDLGLKAGMNYSISSITDFGPATFKNKKGMNTGLFLDYKISEKLTLRPEFLYSSLNIDYKIGALVDLSGNQLSQEFNGTNKERYIDLPLLIKYHLIDKLNILVGPQFGFNINDDNRVVIDDNDISRNTKAKDQFNFSGNFGLGYDLTNQIGLDIRYNFSLIETNGFKNSSIGLNIDFKI